MSVMKFRKIKESDLEAIMNWRMRPDITKYMNTDPKLTLDDQYRWFDKIKKENDSFYWIVESDGKSCGLVSLVNWDKKNSVIHSGAYIAVKECRSLKNILDMNMNLFAYAIESLHINRVSIEVLNNNAGQLNWVPRFGAKKEGVLRQAINKNEVYYDLHLFSILACEWEKIKQKIHFEKIEIEQ